MIIPASLTDAEYPQRYLILDTSCEPPRWVLATVTTSSDVMNAIMDGRKYTGWNEATAWVRDQVGRKVNMRPVAATAWRVDESAR